MMNGRILFLLPSIAAFVVVPHQQYGNADITGRRTQLFVQDESPSQAKTFIAPEPVAVDVQGSEKEVPTQLTEHQMDFICGYLNKHHSSFLLSLVKSFSSIGQEMASANTWSGGSYSVLSAQIEEITTKDVMIHAVIQQRKKNPENRTVQIALDADFTIPTKKRGFQPLPPVGDDPLRWPIDDVCRKLCRFAWMVKEPKVSGKLIQLAIQLDGEEVGKIPEDMYLNQVPHNPYVRQWFYDKAAIAIHDAVVDSSHRSTSRLLVSVTFPETNPSMDSYRIGTLLELIRTAAVRLAQANKRVRICVQNSMGVGIFTGLPKQLTGVSTLLQRMDWQTGPGELYEGIVGDYVRFGAVGADHVLDDDDCFLLIAPQNMVGTDSSIHPLLKAMVDKAGDRPVILFNPDLTDKVSAAGQQSVRGRAERIEFENSFETIFQFSNIYISGTSYFPILGATTKLHPTEPWITHQRRDFEGGGEVYVPVLAGETPASGESILDALEK